MTQPAIHDYIHRLYQSILLRNGDAEGTTYWSRQAENGLTSMSMAQSFITSTEAHTHTSVLRLYDIFFDRAPDITGLKYWIGKLHGGASLQDLAFAFGASPVFQSKHANTSTSDYVEALYLSFFERDSDAGGKAFWVDQLDSGRMTRAEVALSFTVSDEARSSASAATRFAESYLALRSSGMDEPTTALAKALAKKSLADAIAELQSIKGSVQNGIIQGATVFRDANGDGLPDAGATTVTTDANGKFTLVGGYGPIVATGGKDMTTGKANDTVLIAPVPTLGASAETMITPMTTMVNAMAGQGLSIAEAAIKVKTALGLDLNLNLLTFNHTAVATASGSSTVDVKNAVAMKGAVTQLAVIMDITAGLIKGAAGSAIPDTSAITVRVAHALADKIISATASASSSQHTPLMALESQDLIKALIGMTAAKAGVVDATTMDKITSLAADAALIISALNTTVKAAVSAAINASTFNTAIAIDAFSVIARVDAVANGMIENAITAEAANGSLSNAASSFTGSRLATLIKSTEIGNIAQGVSSTSGGTVMDQAILGLIPPVIIADPVEEAPWTPVFTVAEHGTTHVVSFGGDATGDIVISIAGGTATFSRGGITASTGVASIATKTIALTAGQTLAVASANVTALNGVTFTGAGTLKAIEALSVAQYVGMNFLAWTGTTAYSLNDTVAGITGAAPSVVNGAADIAATGTATVAQATAIEAATNTGTTSIAALTDTAAAISGSSNAVLNLVTGAVTASDNVAVADVAALQVFTKAVVYNIRDTVANITGAPASALNSAVNISATGTATVAQATIIEAATNTGTTSIAALTDTAIVVAASSNAVLNQVTGIVRATGVATIAQATTIEGFTKAVTLFTLTDTAAAIAGSSNAVLNQVTLTVTATGVATVAQATTIEGFTKTVTVSSLTDTATAIAGSNNAVLDQVAGTVTATGTATVAEATTIEGFTKAVTVSALTDTAAAIAGSSNAVLSQVTGTVTATGDATVAQAATLQGFTKAVVYHISETASTVAAATATVLNDAVNITATGPATAAQASTIFAATNSGTTTVDLETAYVSGGMLSGFRVGDVLDIDGNDAMTDLLAPQASSAALGDGNWHFNAGTLTWWDAEANAGTGDYESIVLTGVASVTVAGDVVTVTGLL
ncbi:DUF4214 domain-containing protein [Herbaspirillum sp. GCM10030257]|uniref:DUF4214 domain-containing protein n=1 Tax=Herbaspirillum sp. GCM10030257 TaxID=3273393 RepID=UPI00361D94F1